MTLSLPLVPFTVIISACLILLGACSPGTNLSPGQNVLAPGIHKVTLSEAQMSLVKSSVQTMLKDQSPASFNGVNAIFVDTLAAIQVCGTVTADAQTPLPFYLELTDRDGKTEAKRGQIGATPSKLAKVRFMCRRNGNI